jgi:hypothetical protein
VEHTGGKSRIVTLFDRLVEQNTPVAPMGRVFRPRLRRLSPHSPRRGHAGTVRSSMATTAALGPPKHAVSHSSSSSSSSSVPVADHHPRQQHNNNITHNITNNDRPWCCSPETSALCQVVVDRLLREGSIRQDFPLMPISLVAVPP